MPNQQTNLASATGRDATGLRRALTLVKDTTGEALAATRPDASVAALRDALSEKQAAGPPTVSTRSGLSLLRRYWRAFQERRQRARLRVSLHELSDRELVDIGLTPGEIDCIVARRTLKRLRDGTTYPWLFRGVM